MSSLFERKSFLLWEDLFLETKFEKENNKWEQKSHSYNEKQECVLS